MIATHRRFAASLIAFTCLLLLWVLGWPAHGALADFVGGDLPTPHQHCITLLASSRCEVAASFGTVELAQTDDTTLAGRASVIDGDTIEIHGQRIRLHGIDAPESGQTCETNGRTYRCGQAAALALDELIGGRPVDCRRTDIDRYGRVVAVCSVAGIDLNGRLVEMGWALAYRQYSLDYVNEEERAASLGVGMWAGSFVAPWDFRHGTGSASTSTSQGQTSNGCQIKGNISSSGERIYHVPGGQYYDRTKIDESKGERWFCTEEDAVAAGWRRSKR